MEVAQFPHQISMADDDRGRDPHRESMSLEDTLMENGDDGSDKDALDTERSPKRKRRRSRKGLDKKYECPHPGCGKSYSRLEHLYRHQLNHDPKQIYHCSFQDCVRSFVRQDLCLRHQERHTNRGSQLQRKDMLVNGTVVKRERKDSTFNKESSSPDTSGTLMKEEVPSPDVRGVKAVVSPTASSSNSVSSKTAENKAKPRRTVLSGDSNAKVRNEQRPSTSTTPISAARRPSVDVSKSKSETTPNGHHFAGMTVMSTQTQSNGNFTRPKLQTNITTPNIVGLSLTSPYTAQTPHSATSFLSSQQHRQQAHHQSSAMTTTFNHEHSLHNGFIPQNGFPPFSLPPPGFSTTPTSLGHTYGVTSPPASNNSVDHPGGNANVAGNPMTQAVVDPLQYAVPVFGGDSYNRSPFMITDDFAAWLFEDSNFSFSQGSRSAGLAASFYDGSNPLLNQIYLSGQDFPQPGLYGNTSYHHPMSVTSIIAPPSPPQESLLSEHKRIELTDMIEAYPESSIPAHCTSHFTTAKQLVDNHQHDDGALGLNSMQLYISLFWQHFHPQLPILHKATFAADKTHHLLLLAILAIGAACVDRLQYPELAPIAADVSTVIAMNLRWQIFDHADFRPPAKLWIFQALILLETHEKMYSTRQLHERAHIHHATTLTLMRRGSSLQGRCALDSPPSVRDEKMGGGMGNGPSGNSSGASTPDEWWNHWIQSEATKRAAFAAFVLDSVHATMFGHSTVMVAHEMRLALPCDETLWNASSSAEVGRLKQALYNAGVKPTMFLEGLKRTLNGQTVRTNSFGRTIIMSGLLSVSWHMNQRDLQVSCLGVAQALGGKDKWRGALTRAFDLWRTDFDKSLNKVPNAAGAYGDINDFYMPTGEDAEHDNVFEARTVLHHLAHMAMHVDIVDLQIYAGARRLLGRSIGNMDFTSAQKRMRDWANTARARDAVYYALQFLRQVLYPTIESMHGMPLNDSAPPAYIARDDYLLNRPWVLYFATLVVWAYGFALDGVLQQSIHIPTTPQEKYRDMRLYLVRVGHRSSPDELTQVSDRNRNLGLLVVLKDMFSEMRWELLQEASFLLGQCIEISTGTVKPV